MVNSTGDYSLLGKLVLRVKVRSNPTEQVQLFIAENTSYNNLSHITYNWLYQLASKENVIFNISAKES